MKSEYWMGALVGAAVVGGVSWFAWSRHSAAMAAGAYGPTAATGGTTTTATTQPPAGLLGSGQTLGDFVDAARSFFGAKAEGDEA